MNDIEKNLIKLLRSTLDESYTANSEIPLSEMDEIINESIFQSVLTNISDIIPEIYQQKYSSKILNAYLNNVAVINHHFIIGNLLEKNNINYCVLKGFSSAMYYENPEKRMMGDIDILVNSDDVEKVDKLLIDDGYTKVVDETEHDFHSGYIKNGMLVEIHHLISNIAEVEIDLYAMTSEILNSCRFVQCEYGKIRIPNPFYHIVIMLFHLYRHFLSSGTGLRHIIDWAVFISSEDFNKIQSLFWEKCSQWKLLKFAKTLCQISVVYFGVPDKKEYGKTDNELCNIIINEILSKGNFGIKSDERFSGLFVEKRLDGNKSGLSNFYLILKNAVYKHYGQAKHNKIVFVYGMVFFPLRYLFRMIVGKRPKVNIFSLYKTSRKKQKKNRKLSDD